MDWFMHHPVLLGLVGAAVAVAYGLYLTWWLLQQPAGNERMQEISAAVQEGAAAYLKKQYTTIAIVAVVPFILLGVYHKLGWGPAFGFLVGAVALGRSRLHRDERRRALERPHRGGRARGAQAGARRRVQGGLGHRAARRRPRPVRRHRLLLVPDRRAAQLADLGDQRPRSVSRSAARSSPSSPGSAAASSRRPPTSAPTSSASSRPASRRTTRATRL